MMAGIDTLLASGGIFTVPLMLGAMVLWYALGYRAMILRPGARGLLGRAARIASSSLDAPGRKLRWVLDERFGELESEAAKGRSLVDSVVVAAPLLGLLGTVNGMIETFDSLADMALFSQSGGIAGGISEALITTELGLAIAIPGLILGQLLTRRQERIATELEQLKDRVCTQRKVGAGSQNLRGTHA